MSKFNQQGIAQVLVLLLILGGIAAGVYLVSQRTNLLPKAQTPKAAFAPSPYCNPKEKDDQKIRLTWKKIRVSVCQNGKQDSRYECGKEEKKLKETCPISSPTPKPSDSPKPKSTSPSPSVT